MNNKIDFVVTWVNGNDRRWKNKKNRYEIETLNQNEKMNSNKAYRDWGIFKYWFRGVEKFAPWVNRVFLVTDEQVPEWLNINNPKLKIVDHKDFIPLDCLPVFNSNAIELNIYRIKELSDKFVLFNDDMFLTKATKPEDFFYKDFPCDILALNPIIPERNGTGNFQVNDMEIINTYFSKKNIFDTRKLLLLKYGLDVFRTVFQMPSKFICGFYEPHMPYSLKKKTFSEVWEKEYDILYKTSKSKFREKTNVSVWLMRYWQLASGEFYPRNSKKFGKLFSLDGDNKEIYQNIVSEKYKIMCINDGFYIDNFKETKKNLVQAFNELLPLKSTFEI